MRETGHFQYILENVREHVTLGKTWKTWRNSFAQAMNRFHIQSQGVYEILRVYRGRSWIHAIKRNEIPFCSHENISGIVALFSKIM